MRAARPIRGPLRPTSGPQASTSSVTDVEAPVAYGSPIVPNRLFLIVLVARRRTAAKGASCRPFSRTRSSLSTRRSSHPLVRRTRGVALLVSAKPRKRGPRNGRRRHHSNRSRHSIATIAFRGFVAAPAAPHRAQARTRRSPCRPFLGFSVARQLASSPPAALALWVGRRRPSSRGADPRASLATSPVAEPRVFADPSYL